MDNTDNVTIRINNLSIGYGSKKKESVVARGLSAVLEKGEMVCLLGPNGAGKSTLLRTLAGFQPSLGGKVLLLDKDLKEYNNKDLSRIISVVLTDNSGIKNMTAQEVVAIGRSPYTGFWGKIQEADKEVIKRCMEWVGITQLADRKMQTLSDGERQKVMIAKAIAQETPVIFLDEPTAYLDYPSKVSMMLLLHRLAKALKKTVLLSTHDLEHALQVADKVWLMDKEKGLATGLPEDLCAEGKISEYFANDSLEFDPLTCAFAIRHDTAREIAVEGDKDSLRYKLLCRAMRRYAVKVVDESDDKHVKIRVRDDGKFGLIVDGAETIAVDKIQYIIKTSVSAVIKSQIADIQKASNLNPDE